MRKSITTEMALEIINDPNTILIPTTLSAELSHTLYESNGGIHFTIIQNFTHHESHAIDNIIFEIDELNGWLVLTFKDSPDYSLCFNIYERKSFHQSSSVLELPPSEEVSSGDSPKRIGG